MSTGLVVGVGPRNARSFDQITIDNTSGGIGLTQAKINKTATVAGKIIREDAIGVTITVDTDAIRFTIDGTAPTASLGHYMPAQNTFEIWGLENLNKFRAIRVTANATLNVTYYGS